MSSLTPMKMPNNLFQFKGEVEYWADASKKVIIDNEEYINRKRELKTVCLSQLEKENTNLFEEFNYDFKMLNYRIGIKDCYYTPDNIEFIYSSNRVVDRLFCFYEKGFLSKKIKGLYSGKGRKIYPIRYEQTWDWLISTSRIPIQLFSYGFNNGVSYEINFRELYFIDYKLIPDDVIRFFNHYGYTLKYKNRLEECMSILNKKIAYKQKRVND